MSFKNSLSQPGAVRILKGYLEKNRLPHALLFSGPPESGQLDAASDLAQSLFCRLAKSHEPCGECPDCRQVAAGSHPDFTVLRPEDGHALKVEPVRDLMTKASLKPFSAPSKVFVIDHADCLNDIAQNALLKTLEEPQGRTYFILISYANEKLMATIRSRAQTLYFTPLDSETALEPEIQAARRDILSFICGEGDRKTAETVSLEREEVRRILDRVVRDLRDMLLMRAGAAEVLGFIEDKPLKERALKNFSEDELLDKIETLSEFREKIASSANLKLALAVLRDELPAARGKK